MTRKWAFFAVSTAFLILAVNVASAAVDIDTTKIDLVRKKQILDSGDFKIIDDFVDDAVNKLLKTDDWTGVSDIRSAILSRTSSNEASAQAQYQQQFSESAYKYISRAFQKASKFDDAKRKLNVTINLLILVDRLEDLQFANLAIKLLNNETTVIRYWAVHCLTNPGIIKKLNTAENSELTLEIAEELKKLVENSSAEVIGLIVGFIAEVDITESEELLEQITDMRISKYADWTVDYELLDARILGLLYKKMSSGKAGNEGYARRFGQLYSYAIQRYVKGQNVLSDIQKQRLASVLVETERSYISKILGSQSSIRTALGQDDFTALMQEHIRLLGAENRAGQLPSKLKFDYGIKPDGNRRIAPLSLPEPPSKK